MARFFTGLFGSRKPTSPPASTLRINSSVQGQPIPILLAGAQRMAGTIIDYFNLYYVQTSSSSSGGGKGGGTFGAGGKGQSGGYNYFLTYFLMGFCEGPADVGSAFWTNGSGPGNTAISGESFLGDYTQNPWGF